VRREEFAELGPRRRVAETADQLAPMIDDADPCNKATRAAKPRRSRLSAEAQPAPST
jgi:hypothetical protein